MSRLSIDSSELWNQFSYEMDPMFNGLTHINNHDSNFEQMFSFPSHANDDLFRSQGATAATDDSMNHSSDHTRLYGKSIANADYEPFDFNMQDAVSNSLAGSENPITDSRSSPHDFGANTLQNHSSRGLSMDSALQKATIFDHRQVPQQAHSPTSTGSGAPSPHGQPDTQTTIRFEGSDPSTVSDVISVLVKSKAKFVYETR